jgi:hypothetical protein
VLYSCLPFRRWWKFFLASAMPRMNVVHFRLSLIYTGVYEYLARWSMVVSTCVHVP